MHRKLYAQVIIGLSLILSGLWLAGCGAAAPSGPTPTSALDATPLKAEFKQPTTIIKKEEEAAAATATPVPDAGGVDLSRGERTYTSKECAACHGARGEGVEGKGNKLAGTSLTEQEFSTILRTGGQGSLGNDHLYGTQAISPSGMEALYAFVKSFE